MRKRFTCRSAITLILSAVLFWGCINDNFNDAIIEENKVKHKLDTNSPVPGNGGTIIVSNVAGDSLTLSWIKSTDDRTKQEDLQYTIYKSHQNNVDTFENAQLYGTPVVPGWTVDIDSVNILGLEHGINYFFNVFVRDAENKISAYKTQGKIDLDDVIIMFSGGTHNGDLEGREGADGFCRAARESNYPQLPGTCVRAFISTGPADSIAAMPENYNVPWTFPIIGVSSVRIADSWNDLIDGSIAVSPGDAGIVQSPWWSGTTSNGDATGTGPGNNCMGWTLGDISDEGFPGSHNYSDARWIDEGGEFSCSEELAVLCISWDADCLAPVPGDNGELHASVIGDDNIKIHWIQANDDITSQTRLEYRIYYSENPAITTYENAQNNGAQSTAGWIADIGKWNVTGLNDETSYYFIVFVRDESGNIAPYTMLTASTD